MLTGAFNARLALEAIKDQGKVEEPFDQFFLANAHTSRDRVITLYASKYLASFFDQVNGE